MLIDAGIGDIVQTLRHILALILALAFQEIPILSSCNKVAGLCARSLKALDYRTLYGRLNNINTNREKEKEITL